MEDSTRGTFKNPRKTQYNFENCTLFGIFIGVMFVFLWLIYAMENHHNSYFDEKERIKNVIIATDTFNHAIIISDNNRSPVDNDNNTAILAIKTNIENEPHDISTSTTKASDMIETLEIYKSKARQSESKIADDNKIKHATWEDYEKSTIPRINWRIDVNNPRGKLCIRKWNSAKQHLGHMHIGKAGGTTFDSILATTIRASGIPYRVNQITNYNKFVDNLPRTSTEKMNMYFHTKHHDMHYINKYINEKYPNITFDHTYTKQLIPQLSLMGFIRNPVERYVCTILII
jgi:hypothetical protein